MQKVEEFAKKSVEEFEQSYEGCPYKNTPQVIPDKIRDVLEDEKVCLRWF